VELLGFEGNPEGLRLKAYSIGFFLFWALTASTSLLTCYFQRPCETKGEPRGA
jgi:hypothetical protein